MKRYFFVFLAIFIFIGLTFANEKDFNKELIPVSFSLITNYTILGENSNFSKSNINNFAASVGFESGDMMNLGIKLTSAGIANIVDGALWISLAYVFVWLMWTEIYPTSTFNSVIAWEISFYGPYDPLSSALYAYLANFSLIFGIISLGIGTLLLIPGIILWAVGATKTTSSKLKKEQKIVLVVAGDKIGVAIKF